MALSVPVICSGRPMDNDKPIQELPFSRNHFYAPLKKLSLYMKKKTWRSVVII
jgi:hypothetical protein